MDLQEFLRHSGLRVTAPRLAVLAALEELPDRTKMRTRWRLRARAAGTLSTQAVYDNLHLLTEAGMVRRISQRVAQRFMNCAWATTTTTWSAGVRRADVSLASLAMRRA